MHHQKASRARYKLLTTLFVAYGLGLLTAGAITPVNMGMLRTINPLQIGLFLTGLVFHGLALYIAPRGDVA